MGEFKRVGEESADQERDNFLSRLKEISGVWNSGCIAVVRGINNISVAGSSIDDVSLVLEITDVDSRDNRAYLEHCMRQAGLNELPQEGTPDYTRLIFGTADPSRRDAVAYLSRGIRVPIIGVNGQKMFSDLFGEDAVNFSGIFSDAFSPGAQVAVRLRIPEKLGLKLRPAQIRIWRVEPLDIEPITVRELYQ